MHSSACTCGRGQAIETLCSKVGCVTLPTPKKSVQFTRLCARFSWLDVHDGTLQARTFKCMVTVAQIITVVGAKTLKRPIQR